MTASAAAAAAEEDDTSSSAVLAKVLAMAFLGVSSFAAGSTPVCVFERLGIRRRARGAANAVLRLVLNFGGGVLLCTTFLHLLPEVREGVRGLIANNTLDADSPVADVLAELVMCAGFFVMYSVEELVHGFAGRDCHAHGDRRSRGGHSHGGHSHGDHSHGDQQQRIDSNGAGPGVQPNAAFEKAEAAAGRMVNYNSCSSAAAVEMAAVKSPAAAQPGESSASKESVLRGFLVIGALSIHELFEGLAVGLERNPKQVWSLTVAVACHKLVIAFYVGLQMLSDRTKPLLAHCSILLFAVTSPIGIGVGAVVSNLEETTNVIVFSVALQGVATGTLMYVVFFEVLKPSEGHLQVKQRLLRLVFIAIGFASMLSIQLMITE